jgi:hypothetical protein
MTTATKMTPKEAHTYFTDLPYAQKIRSGDYTPGPWFTAAPGSGLWGTWGVKAKPGRRGLTFMDLDAAEGGNTAPAVAGESRAPRGAGEDPDNPPHRRYELSQKYEVWAENVATLLEEAKSRQWSATSDIPWEKLQPLAPDLERALCQYLTFLTGGEFLANDQLGFLLGKINPAYMETKLFLATQIMDEARHTEVFRKRCLANGGGMGMSFSALGQNNSSMAMAAQHPALAYEGSSFVIHVLTESVVLDYFRFGEFLGKQEVDKEIFRRVLQDEARHVSYGTMHLKFWIENLPRAERDDAVAALHSVADSAEVAFGTWFMMHPSTVESMAILAADGVAQIEKGFEIYRHMWNRTVAEYLNRCDRAGFDRRLRCLLPQECPI